FTVKRQSLSSQTQVSATLGYADASTVGMPGGTSLSALQQAQQQLTTAQAQLAASRTALSNDSQALTQAEERLSADRAKLTVDCGGDNAAEAAGTSGSGAGSATGVCASDAQTVSSDEQSVAQARAKEASDRQALASAQAGVTSAQKSLAQARVSATVYGESSTYTDLPAVGQIVARGQALLAVGGEPVVLLYGTVAAWRAFISGMSPGRDVAELNANLRALGYGAPAGDQFTGATAAAIDAFQAVQRMQQTGELLLGSIVFEPGAVRVTSVTPTLGATVQPGPVLGTTSTRRQVTIALDAAQQSDVKVGDPVTITLPDNSTTPGRVSYVGTVATVPSSDNGGADNGNGSTPPTIEVDVTPTDPAATGRLDQAPVNVSITTGSVQNALVVPVNALLALASGGYAVEEVGAGGVHQLVAVQLGLFDDADGMVQVSGSGLAAGRRVVVPSQ
ncbi:MAG TPA: peptidoglycan-binding protein, partial [Acidimicrobiia bacterium]|nr:peptidoglycan-binding protein [Acidimicrobiia bacterium]